MIELNVKSLNKILILNFSYNVDDCYLTVVYAPDHRPIHHDSSYQMVPVGSVDAFGHEVQLIRVNLNSAISYASLAFVDVANVGLLFKSKLVKLMGVVRKCLTRSFIHIQLQHQEQLNIYGETDLKP